MKKKNIKIIIASVLILLGIGSLLLWETWGREYVTYTYVITASRDIEQGEKISEEMMESRAIQKDNLINGAMNKDEALELIGKISKHYIAKGAQLNQKYFTTEDFYLSKDQSIFKIPAAWIDSRSASIRRGDKIEIYGADGNSFGVYTVAFVKDAQEREITSTDSKWEEALERTDATGMINNIEIITTVEKYNVLKQQTEADPETAERFMIVQIF